MRTGRTGLHALFEVQLETCQERTGARTGRTVYMLLGVSVGHLSGED